MRKREQSTEFGWLNDALFGRTIIDVEAGHNNGWVLLHFSLTNEEKKASPEGSRILLTIKVDGKADDPHCWNAGLHTQNSEGGGCVTAIRDHRPATERKLKVR